MRRGICGLCEAPVTWLPVLTGKRATEDGMWVHDNKQDKLGHDIEHDPVSVHSITNS